ncbi:FkbM family methyltransferase, partial [Escherichia coli]|nr:FkbM family methyltransferase [Escherichia coli]
AKDSGAIRLSLEKYGEWAENEISFIKKFLQDGDTVIDVGAYIGTHTLAFARHVGLGGSVIAIEAQKTTHQLLIRNIEANALANVRIENAIAGAQVGDRDLLAINPDSSDSFGSASVLAAV